MLKGLEIGISALSKTISTRAPVKVPESLRVMTNYVGFDVDGADRRSFDPKKWNPCSEGHMTVTNSKYREVIDIAGAIEREMKRLGLWNLNAVKGATPKLAFGADVLSFEDWLQYVLVPRLHQSADNGAYPSDSNLAVAAVRNFGGMDGVEPLIDLLRQLDRLVSTS